MRKKIPFVLILLGVFLLTIVSIYFGYGYYQKKFNPGGAADSSNYAKDRLLVEEYQQLDYVTGDFKCIPDTNNQDEGCNWALVGSDGNIIYIGGSSEVMNKLINIDEGTKLKAYGSIRYTDKNDTLYYWVDSFEKI